jgi:hypothetical protein
MIARNGLHPSCLGKPQNQALWQTQPRSGWFLGETNNGPWLLPVYKPCPNGKHLAALGLGLEHPGTHRGFRILPGSCCGISGQLAAGAKAGGGSQRPTGYQVGCSWRKPGCGWKGNNSWKRTVIQTKVCVFFWEVVCRWSHTTSGGCDAKSRSMSREIAFTFDVLRMCTCKRQNAAKLSKWLLWIVWFPSWGGFLPKASIHPNFKCTYYVTSAAMWQCAKVYGQKATSAALRSRRRGLGLCHSVQEQSLPGDFWRFWARGFWFPSTWTEIFQEMSDAVFHMAPPQAWGTLSNFHDFPT